VGLSAAVVHSARSRAASTEPGAVKQRTRPSSLVSWRTSPPSYAADTVSSMTLRAGHVGRHRCAAGGGDGVVVCSRFRKSMIDFRLLLFFQVVIILWCAVNVCPCGNGNK